MRLVANGLQYALFCRKRLLETPVSLQRVVGLAAVIDKYAVVKSAARYRVKYRLSEIDDADFGVNAHDFGCGKHIV